MPETQTPSAAPPAWTASLNAVGASVVGGLLMVYEVLAEPVLAALHLYHRPDPTFGRARLPLSRNERAFIYENPEVKAQIRQVHLTAEQLRKGRYPLRPQDAVVTYYVWERLGPQGGPNPNDLQADLVCIHGLNDYGGKFGRHAQTWMSAGFRVVTLDLPSYGRSFGMHSYLPSMRILAEAVFAVIEDVRRHDAQQGTGAERKLFLQGQSMGAFTALYYTALYGHSSNPPVDGISVACPMLAISPHSRPSKTLETFARAMASVLGRLPIAKAIKGNISDDPRVEEESALDPMMYHGRLRIATGLAVMEGLLHFQTLVNQGAINEPIVIFHGDKDRVTDWHGSEQFLHLVHSKDKTLHIKRGYEHGTFCFSSPIELELLGLGRLTCVSVSHDEIRNHQWRHVPRGP